MLIIVTGKDVTVSEKASVCEYVYWVWVSVSFCVCIQNTAVWKYVYHSRCLCLWECMYKGAFLWLCAVSMSVSVCTVTSTLVKTNSVKLRNLQEWSGINCIPTEHGTGKALSWQLCLSFLSRLTLNMEWECACSCVFLVGVFLCSSLWVHGYTVHVSLCIYMSFFSTLYLCMCVCSLSPLLLSLSLWCHSFSFFLEYLSLSQHPRSAVLSLLFSCLWWIVVSYCARWK